MQAAGTGGGDASDLWLLGGRDLEMVTIRALLERHAPGRVVDRGLGWGARASDYADHVAAALSGGLRPVLVELAWDLEPALRPQVVEIDHHGALAGHDRPTSLHQVFDRLALPPSLWTRHMDLVAANDRGHVAAMAALGADAQEMRAIRAADRRAQGVTEAEEVQAEQAVARRRTIARPPAAPLVVVQIPTNRSSAVADRMEPLLDGPGYECLLVSMPGELAVFGTGRDIMALAAAFPGGWHGGDLPARGFWGHPADAAVTAAAVIAALGATAA